MDDRHPLAALWSARSIAVVGASDRPGALGRLPVEFLQRYGYRGRVFPVRPDGAPVCGLASYPSVQDCGAPVELAMIMVAAARVPEAVADCVAAGVPVAVICTSGFAETGEDGMALQASVAQLAQAGGVRLLGPNCIGTVGVGNRQVSSFSPLFSGEHTALVPGRLGFATQSGALGYGAVSLAFERGLGLGWIVNTGNEADVSTIEVMAAMAAEEDCRGILAYAETLTDFAGLTALAATGVPVAVLKSGRSEAGAAAAASHTGALAAQDLVVDAALRQLGIVRVDDVEELLDVGEIMTLPRPAGRGVAVITTSGGSGILATDAMDRHGLALASLSAETTEVLDEIVPSFGSTANPVDVTASVMSNAQLFDRSLAAIAGDPAVDVILACFCVLTGSDVDDVIGSLAHVARASGKPVVAVRTGADHLAPGAVARMREVGIPTYPTPARAVRAIAALAQFADNERTPRPAAATPTAPTDANVPDPGSTEDELKAWLSHHGVPVPAGRMVTAPPDARSAVDELGGLAVAKAIVPGLVHKTEAGAVVVGVTADDAAAAYDRLLALGGRVWFEELVSTGVETLVGATSSALGPVLTVGVGGTLTEIVAEVSMRVLPVTLADVEAMIDETLLGRLLAGVRGRPAADRAALVDCVVRVAELVSGWPAGLELDLNPVTVLAAGHGVRVLDAALVMAVDGGDHAAQRDTQREPLPAPD